MENNNNYNNNYDNNQLNCNWGQGPNNIPPYGHYQHPYNYYKQSPQYKEYKRKNLIKYLKIAAYVCFAVAFFVMLSLIGDVYDFSEFIMVIFAGVISATPGILFLVASEVLDILMEIKRKDK